MKVSLAKTFDIGIKQDLAALFALQLINTMGKENLHLCGHERLESKHSLDGSVFRRCGVIVAENQTLYANHSNAVAIFKAFQDKDVVEHY